ncbi:MAG TPA: NAD(P)-binding protein [Allosphingosinicella sp.]
MGLRQPHRVLWVEPLLICGFGEVGSALARFALGSGRHPHQIIVIDQDPERARRAGDCGYRAVASDPTSAPALRAAGIGSAGRIIICLADDEAVAAVHAVRSLAPRASIQVVLRDRRLEGAAAKAGADLVLPLSKLAGTLLADAALRSSEEADVPASG